MSIYINITPFTKFCSTFFPNMRWSLPLAFVLDEGSLYTLYSPILHGSICTCCCCNIIWNVSEGAFSNCVIYFSYECRDIYTHASVTLIYKMFIFWDNCLLKLKGDPAYKRRLTAWQVCYNLCLRPIFKNRISEVRQNSHIFTTKESINMSMPWLVKVKMKF